MDACLFEPVALPPVMLDDDRRPNKPDSADLGLAGRALSYSNVPPCPLDDDADKIAGCFCTREVLRAVIVGSERRLECPEVELLDAAVTIETKTFLEPMRRDEVDSGRVDLVVALP